MSEQGLDAWKEHTSAFDRVRSVAQTVSNPRSVAWIAERAAVAENTARDHLERLVELNVLLAYDREGATKYGPDPMHARLQTLRELVEEYDHDELLDRKAALQGDIEEWQAEYGVESVGALREQAATAETATGTKAIRQTADDWELTAYRLGIVEDAIENYAAYSRSDIASA